MDLIKFKLLDIVRNSSRISSIIQAIKLIDNEELYLSGGLVRNVVWNHLHFYTEEYELEDCDIIFFNPRNVSKSYEETIKSKLTFFNPNIKWSVKNQARMHTRNKHEPYSGIYNALITSPETCSAVAIDKYWNILSPYGVDDLLNLVVTPTQFCIDNEIEVYDRRISQKNWLSKWSNLKIERDASHNKKTLFQDLSKVCSSHNAFKPINNINRFNKHRLQQYPKNWQQQSFNNRIA